MRVRRAKTSDLPEVLAIYEAARDFMRHTGNPSQWGEDYPPVFTVREDLNGGHLFVIEKDGTPCGVFAFFPEGDPAYDEMPSKWLNALPYAAIHRVASAGTERGVLASCVDYALSVCNNIKIDTHKDNRVMQSALAKLGFKVCGEAVIPEVGERILYQRFDGSQFERSSYDEK